MQEIRHTVLQHFINLSCSTTIAIWLVTKLFNRTVRDFWIWSGHFWGLISVVRLHTVSNSRLGRQAKFEMEILSMGLLTFAQFSINIHLSAFSNKFHIIYSKHGGHTLLYRSLQTVKKSVVDDTLPRKTADSCGC